MKEDKLHIIHKVLAELNIGEVEKRPDTSERLKEALETALANMGPVLDQAGSNEYLKIDSLSVEVSLPSAKLDQLDGELEKAIRKKINELIPSELSAESAEQEPVKFDRLPDEERYQELFRTFLMTGSLPWWADREMFLDLETWLDELPVPEWLSISESILHNEPRAAVRLTAQFPKSLIRKLIRQSLQERFGDERLLLLRDQIISFLEAEEFPEVGYQEIDSTLYTRLIYGISTGLGGDELAGRLFQQTVKEIKQGTEDQKAEEGLLKSFRKRLMTGEFQGSQKLLDQIAEKSYDSSGELSADEMQLTEEELQEAEGEQVSHAGLVLLHPFLPNYFKNLGYLEKSEFINEAARERAVCLMHHLATGDEEFPEFELILPKFLCEWSLEEPVKRYLPLTDAEKTESVKLLESCIQHWDALKSTGIDGLRQNFIRRDGILRKEPFGWSLYVERNTHDILLQKLPWNLSVMKLPWMDEMLTVHWIS